MTKMIIITCFRRQTAFVAREINSVSSLTQKGCPALTFIPFYQHHRRWWFDLGEKSTQLNWFRLINLILELARKKYKRLFSALFTKRIVFKNHANVIKLLPSSCPAYFFLLPLALGGSGWTHQSTWSHFDSALISKVTTNFSSNRFHISL